MFSWRRQVWHRSLGALALVLILLSFSVGPSLEDLTCHDGHASASASLDHGPDGDTGDDGKDDCGACHHAGYGLAPMLIASREPASVAYREPTPVIAAEVAWPAFRQERPPRA